MNARDIKRRMKSIENTRQITRAMEMVAATKMRKAQAAVTVSRDYADRARKLLAAVSAEAAPEDIENQPLLRQRSVKRTAFVVLGSDRGLCGSMNTNTFKAAVEAATDATNPAFVAIGRKAEQAFRKQSLVASFGNLADLSHYEEVLPMAELLAEEFTAERLDKIVMIYPEFVSTLTNKPRVETLLPAILPKEESVEPTKDAAAKAQTLYEPSPEAVLTSLLPRMLETRLFQALLETKASEHSARMMAMRNASNNAGDLLDELKFTYNQARQAAITQEIAEIAAAGAVA